MKPALAGILTFVVFFFGNSYFLGGLGQLCLIGGDTFVNSYFAPTMTGLALLAGLVVGCTLALLQKLDAVQKALNDRKSHEQ